MKRKCWDVGGSFFVGDSLSLLLLCFFGFVKSYMLGHHIYNKNSFSAWQIPRHDSVSMERLKSAVQSALTKRKLSIALKKEQMECLYATRFYGKSLIFQLLPDIYDHLLHVENSVVLIVSPFNALMHNQITNEVFQPV